MAMVDGGQQSSVGASGGCKVMERVDGQGGESELGERPGVRTRRPYMKSKGKMRRGCLGRAHSLKRARGRSFTQSR